MKHLSLLILFSMLAMQFLFAQHEIDNWYFGNQAGMNFNSGAPVVLTDGQTNTVEGTAVISDAAGNLLFYTDGVTVWNRLHNVMNNGTGLHGGTSSSQSALILQLPGSDTLFYIFTTGEQGAYGFQYSIVDLSLQAGNGEVILKNVVVLNNTNEQQAAVSQPNGIDHWVITHTTGNSNFYAYQFTSSGLNISPVISSVGTVNTGQIGYLRASHNGEKLALSNHFDFFFELFDFDNSTGSVSNAINLGCPPVYLGPYGIEFAPNDSLLYGTPFEPPEVYQWDISSGIASQIIASQTTIGTASSFYGGALQLAEDGKIYMANYNTQFLSVIDSPNIAGIGCHFVDNGFSVAPKLCQAGLPNFPAGFSSLIKVENTCFGDSASFLITNAAGDSIVSWDFGDPASGIANTDTGTIVHHVFTAMDTFQVTVIEYLLNGSTDTTYLNVVISGMPVIALGNDTSVCIGDTLILDAGNAGAGFSWSNGSSSQTIAVTDSGTYSVVVNNGGCKNIDSINVSFINCALLPQPGISVIDPAICEKFCLDFTDQSTNNPTAWLWTFEGGSPPTSTLQNPTQICYNLPGTYDVTLTASNGFGSLTQTFPNYITVYATPPFPVINQSGYTLFSSFATSYQWQFNSVDIFGATGQSYTVTQSGYYTVVVWDSHGCINYTTVYILISGVGDVGGPANVFITPNPSDGNFMVELINGLMAEKIFVKVTNDLGQIVFSLEEQISSSHWKKEIDVSDVARGIYFIEIKTEHEFVRKKILIAD